jgi:hypothetical protein
MSKGTVEYWASITLKSKFFQTTKPLIFPVCYLQIFLLGYLLAFFSFLYLFCFRISVMLIRDDIFSNVVMSETFFQNQNFAIFHKNREENFVERRAFANLANINIVMSLVFWESRRTFFKLIFTETVTETEIIYLLTKQRTEYNYI